MSDFDDLIEKLTRTHDVHYQTDDGTKTTTVPGLLEQLRDEVFGGSERGASSGNKTKLPLNAPAADLYSLIDRQISEVWSAAFDRIPNADRPEQLLVSWAALVGEHKIVTVSVAETIKYADPTFDWEREAVIWNPLQVKATDLLGRWIQSIEDMFNPPRTAPIVAACIQCGERSVWRERDGQKIKLPALMFVRSRETGDSTSARCQACGVTWLPSQFKYLAESIAENEKRSRQSPKFAVAETLPVVQ